MSDEDLSKKIESFQELAKDNPEVDVNMLMANALATANKQGEGRKSYRWAYLVSSGAPPLGLIFAAKYYMSGDENDLKAAYICVGLTVASLLMLYFLGKLVFSSSGASIDQIQQIKPADIQSLYQ